jgi:hypothetical protein
MSLTLTRIDATQSINLAPNILNNNYTLIENQVNGLLGKLSVSGNTIKLTNLGSISSGDIEAGAVLLTKTTGNLIALTPNGGSTVMRVDENGDIYGNKFTAAGDSLSDATVIKYLDVTEQLRITSVSDISELSLDGRLKLNSSNSSLLVKAQTFAISNDNCGSGASTPLDLSKTITAFLDYDNSGSALSSNAEVNIDLSTVEVDQRIRLVLAQDNATGMNLYNGTNGSEIFAVVDPDNGGIQSLPNTDIPGFAGNSDVLNPAYMLVHCVLVGGSKRLLILESNGVSLS